ncbi:N-acetylmuramoyl-L-alanine amidase [Streptomyces sp. NPDC050121]|uniref:N-acetylmuramoyl-L-alanine amidase n=1 Tax=Streptomyces sp. NPDC050121 TaxID=3365601 RepID=UPI0037977BF8
MERARPLPGRRRILKGAALAAVPYALLPDARAGAQPRTVDYPLAEWQPATASNYTASHRPATHVVDRVVVHVTQTDYDYNTRSVGIEHEGWVDRPEYFTETLYEQSARLTSSVCDRHGIPKDRAHIIGHQEVPGTDHTDPGPNWDWRRYVWLVNTA